MFERELGFQNNKNKAILLKNVGNEQKYMSFDEQRLLAKRITVEIFSLLQQHPELGLQFKDDEVFKSGTEALLRSLSERLKKHCEEFEQHSLIDSKSSVNESYKTLDKIISKIEVIKGLSAFMKIISDKKFFDEINSQSIAK